MDMDINISFLMMTADIISLMLLGTLYFSNKQRMSYDRDMEFIMRMMAITAISNVAGIVFHYFNLNSGLAPPDSGISLRYMALFGDCSFWLYMGEVPRNSHEYSIYSCTKKNISSYNTYCMYFAYYQSFLSADFQQ